MKHELTQRVVSAVILALLSIACLLLASKIVFLAIIFILINLCIFEYLQALAKSGIQLYQPALYISVTLLFAVIWFVKNGFSDYFPIAFVLSFLPLFRGIFRAKQPFLQISLWYLLPLIWILLPLNILAIIRSETVDNSGAYSVLFLVVIVALNDIFAYFGGKIFGKHKLAPMISPKKTIEGAVSGYLGALVSGYVISFFTPGFVFDYKILIIILLVTFAAQVGDLGESKFKRFCRIKDSSNLIPGHGGFLDRFDALLAALPVFWLLKLLLGVRLFQ